MSSALATPVKQIAAGLLDVGYVDVGRPDAPAVVLLHGWPYDIHTYAEVSPLLAAAGHRVIVPYLRGYGTTRFLSADSFRNGQQAVLAVDTVALMDALGIEKAVVAGADWGGRLDARGVVRRTHPTRRSPGHVADRRLRRCGRRLFQRRNPDMLDPCRTPACEGRLRARSQQW